MQSIKHFPKSRACEGSNSTDVESEWAYKKKIPLEGESLSGPRSKGKPWGYVERKSWIQPCCPRLLRSNPGFSAGLLWIPCSTFLMGLKIDSGPANPLKRNMIEISASTVGPDTRLRSPP